MKRRIIFSILGIVLLNGLWPEKVHAHNAM